MAGTDLDCARFAADQVPLDTEGCAVRPTVPVASTLARLCGGRAAVLQRQVISCYQMTLCLQEKQVNLFVVDRRGARVSDANSSHN